MSCKDLAERRSWSLLVILRSLVLLVEVLILDTIISLDALVGILAIIILGLSITLALLAVGGGLGGCSSGFVAELGDLAAFEVVIKLLESIAERTLASP